MLARASRLVDDLERHATSPLARRVRAISLSVVLIGGIGLIELERRGVSSLLDNELTHLAAIAWTVTLLLVFELIELIFCMSRSVATSVGRHLQIFALVLLRDAFAELSKLPEPIQVTPEEFHAIAVMASDAIAAIVLFMLAVWFERLQMHRPITGDPMRVASFIRQKKLVVLGLLLSLVVMLVTEVASVLTGGDGFRVFAAFFTVLVFVDVLFAVISLGVSENSAIVFRNFGFAFAAIVLRLAIASPVFVRPALGVAAGILAIGVTLAFNYSARPMSIVEHEADPDPDEPNDDQKDDRADL